MFLYILPNPGIFRGNPYFFDPDYLTNGVRHVVVGSFGPDGQGPKVYRGKSARDNIIVLLDD